MNPLDKSFTLNWKKVIGMSGLLLGLMVVAGTTPFVDASNHDDDEAEIKGRNLNLTDLYVFREGDQNPSASSDNLVFISTVSGKTTAIGTEPAADSPISGQLPKNDMIDITLSVLTDSAITSNNVSYEGTSDNPSQGHDPLIADFPYLAPANQEIC